MRILVTGSEGFIGGALKRHFEEQDHDVTGMDVQSVVSMDVRHTAAVIGLGRNHEVIFHEAACNLVYSIADPNADADTNIHGALNVLRATDAGRCNLVMASTGSVHPQANGIPGTPYGISKKAAEMYAMWYKEYRGLNVKVLRYFSVYGPGMPTEKRGVIGIFLRRAMEGKPLVVEGGKQERAFCYIDDVVSANVYALHADPGIYEVGTTEMVSIGDLAESIAEEYNVPVEYRDPRPGDDIRRVADTTDMRAQGWMPKVNLKEGIRRTAEWLQTEVMAA